MIRVANRILNSSANKVPLGAENNLRVFKILYMDIDLTCSALNLNVLGLGKEDLSVINMQNCA
ncbi:hypothetical protein SAMN05216302_10241 [Nitrosomonas aestuarii]|uniref:Uncharacterized protein n=1 Tax=Nitrosomonas aestuarii TaxID=52441 RepID=A0A1I4E0E8_9PROT|nr:hypothetical protein SAMN05216302_10241 [Nitrosomonas aestuarii]